ncbi:hypothetical protein [Bradyrhizobium sp. Ai1a-2]|uniref:hypothetical protein n=1 Tax=Bradyrhizobium sp. Ai1a-2 TaxID=196490 RepID=UPI00040A9450|nr:hypothetical protein [Bradyrhizobium sp. Ai1a-2]
MLGTTQRDKITGFQGVVVGHCQYISGCNQALLVPKVGENGAYKESHWFDVQRLERVGNEVITLDNGWTPGFDKPAPIR